jgi:chromosome segregation ATPase
VSRKKQIEELKQRIERLQADFVSAEDHRSRYAARLDTVETTVGSHESAIDVTSELLRLLPAPDSIARTADLQRVAEQAGTAARSAESANTAANTAADSFRRTVEDHERLIAEQRATIEALSERLRSVETSTTESISGVQARLAEVSLQLAYQIEELGRELDSAARRLENSAPLAEGGAPADPVPAAALEDLRAAQIRLASEQVRYELALRAELAELAARLGRPRQ